MSDHLQKNEVNVTGHLEDKRGIYQMVLSWRDTNGKRNRKSLSTELPVKGNKKRAEEMLRDARKEQEKVLIETPQTDAILFADFMELWLNVVKNDLKPTTFGSYQINVQRIIAPYFRKKGILLKDLTAADINEFYEARLKKVKAKTVIEYHNRINSAVKYALRNKLLTHSPMELVKRPKAERFVGKHLSETETVALFDAAQGNIIEFPIILGAFYGLRREEIIGLRWESVNFENNTITIEHTVTETRIDGKTVITAADTTKTKSSHRTLPMIPIIRERLLAHRAQQEKNRELCGRTYNKEEGRYVCTDALGNRIKPDSLTGAFPKFLEKNGFRRVRPHDLRHLYGMLALKTSGA